MNIEKIKSIKMSLMETKSGINESTNKADYLVKGSAKFGIKKEFFANLNQGEEDELTSGLLEAMYEELLNKINDVDTVGLWVEYDGKILENAMKINALEDMKKFGADDVSPIHELFKMTLSL